MDRSASLMTVFVYWSTIMAYFEATVTTKPHEFF